MRSLPTLSSSGPRMRSRAGSRVAWAVLVGLAVLWPVAALAQGSVGWSQFQGGSGHQGAVAGGPEPGYRADWSTSVALGGPEGQFGASAPVVAGGTVVVVSADQVVGIDADDGSSAWSVDRDLGPSVPAAVATVDDREAVVYTEGFGDGPGNAEASTTPAASTSSPTPGQGDGGSGDGGGGGAAFDSHLAAFDLRSREPLFDPVQLDAVSRTGVTVDGSTAFVGVNGGRIYAVDLTDGSVTWTVELGRPVTSPITVAAGRVLVGMQSTASSRLPTVVALDGADGEEAWRVDDQGAAAIVSTVAADATTAYVAFSGSQESSVDALDLETGSARWHARLPRLFDPTGTAPPAVTDDAVVVTDALGVTFALDAETGARLWDFALNQNVLRAAPVVVAGYVLVGSTEGELAAIDIAAGDLVWRSGAQAGQVRALAVAGERIVLVRSGAHAGVQAFVHDPDVMLVREVSPTTADPAKLALGIAVAGVAVGGLTLLLGRFLGGSSVAMPVVERDASEEASEGEGGS